MPDRLYEMDQRLRTLENRFYELGYDMTALVQSEFKKRWTIPVQAETQFGIFTALCVDTVDPWKQNRVRFFSPLFHKPDVPVKSLPWAHPISAFGGFDGCGANWVPPAGSTLCISFENGNRQTPFYHGTTWHRDRGPDGEHNWGYNIDEYYKIHEGHRNGYLSGPNDGSQVFPPWNTESYNGYDIDSISDFENDPEAQRKITYANIYGFTTPQKHTIKMVDGDYKCNHKNKRLEIYSSTGNLIILKDDHLHNSGSWGHTSCGATGSEIICTDENGNPTEQTDCNSEIQSDASNPYFKHENECRPIKGPGTPQNNKLDLPQTGIQFLSYGGHSFIMDDSVEEPSGPPEWERSTQNFDFGCTDKFTGKIKLVSATGHSFEISDVESNSRLRGEDNYIRLKTASGNLIELNDHTVGPSSGITSESDEGCNPSNLAGERRGLTVRTTSNHSFEMLDEDNEQSSPCRKEGGTPIARAKKAFVRMRSGYGLEILMKDEASQEETDTQHIQIFCPHTDNEERGPHILRMQEAPDGPGMVFLRVGGNYICSTYDHHYTVVGDVEDNPANKLTIVSDNTVIDTENFYYNTAEIHAFLADKIILLMAGKDCKPEGWDGDPDSCVPCVWPVLCLTPKGITVSDRVFASASPDASCATITQLMPFHNCSPFEGCS